MNSQTKKTQAIIKICVIALISALSVCLNIFFVWVPGLDFGLFVVVLCCLVFTWESSLTISLAISFLMFFIKPTIIEGLAYLATNITVWLVMLVIRKQSFKYRIIIYIAFLVFSTFNDFYILFFWTAITDWKNGMAIYLARVVHIHVMFALYCFLPIIFLKRIEKLFNKLLGKNDFLFNKNFKQYTEDKENIINMKYYDDKKYYIIQMLSLIVSLMLMVNFLAFIPYKIVVSFNIHYLAAILIVPVLMLIITPNWMKLKKKVGNKNLLQFNSFGLLIATVVTTLAFSFSNNIVAHILLFLGLILFGIFIAGFVPINIEMIKSHDLRNGNAHITNKITSLTIFWTIPIPFIINEYAKNTFNVIFLGMLAVTIIILLFTNKNIMDKGNVLDVDKSQFKSLKSNKIFFISIFSQNLFVGIIKFLEIALCLFFFVRLENKELYYSFNESNIYIYLVLGFLSKFIAQAILRQVSLKEKHHSQLNMIGMLLIVFGFMSLFAYILAYKFLGFNNRNTLYYALLIAVQFLFGAGYILIERTKASYYKTLVSKDEFKMAMIIDHVLGNAFFSLLVNILFLITMVFLSPTIFKFILILGVVFSMTLISMIVNVAIRHKNKTKVMNEEHKIINKI